jgi:hypothetical protein
MWADKKERNRQEKQDEEEKKAALPSAATSAREFPAVSVTTAPPAPCFQSATADAPAQLPATPSPAHPFLFDLKKRKKKI